RSRRLLRDGTFAAGQSPAPFRPECVTENSMPSPFPGMNPYLEDASLWPLFQHHLVICLYQILLPGLVDRYRARIGQRKYTVEGTDLPAEHRERKEEFIEICER